MFLERYAGVFFFSVQTSLFFVQTFLPFRTNYFNFCTKNRPNPLLLSGKAEQLYFSSFLSWQ